MSDKKTNTIPPTFAELGAQLCAKIKAYNRLTTAKTFGATAESRRQACEAENEIALIVARRGIIRKMADTVKAAAENTGAKAEVILDASSVRCSGGQLCYRIALASPSRNAADLAARVITRDLKAACALKCRREQSDDGRIHLILTKTSN